MHRKIIYVFVIILFITGCTAKKQEKIKQDNLKNQANVEKSEMIDNVKIIIDERKYIIKLENSQTVKEITKLLPLELNMNELNNNEKYAYLDKSLSVKPKEINNINKGDIMIYGDNCLVIFYKSFKTNYSYTKIGHIENLPDLGSENIKVKIER